MYKLTISLDDSIYFFEGTYIDEVELCDAVNTILTEQDMNDGCQFKSVEDIIAANSIIAEKTGDITNLLNYILIEEF